MCTQLNTRYSVIDTSFSAKKQYLTNSICSILKTKTYLLNSNNCISEDLKFSILEHFSCFLPLDSCYLGEKEACFLLRKGTDSKLMFSTTRRKEVKLEKAHTDFRAGNYLRNVTPEIERECS